MADPSRLNGDALRRERRFVAAPRDNDPLRRARLFVTALIAVRAETEPAAFPLSEATRRRAATLVRSLYVLFSDPEPCPSCGSARAFLFLARGDPRWRNYNTATVAYAAAAMVASLALVLLPARARQTVADGAAALRRHPRLGGLAVTVAAVPPWLVAMRRPQIRG